MHLHQNQHQAQQHSTQYYIPGHCNRISHNGTCLTAQCRPTSLSYRGDSLARCTDIDESIIGNGNWILGDLHSLHRCIPALRRTGIDVSGIRMHFYPEGGWGWLVCAAGFLAVLLTTGMQLAFGQLHIYIAKHLGQSHLLQIAWIGSLSTAVSLASAPLVLGTCRRGSTRLTAVIGGLVLALAALFTSFAIQPHQILLSYGLVLGTGAGLVRESAGLVLGHYFRKRREFVEMIVQTGAGIGIALFSVFYKEAIGKLGWRLGLQTITGVLFLAFFLGLIYRSASLYHPQRHAIVHLKNQQNKLKPKSKSVLKSTRQPLIDLRPLNCKPVRMLMLATGTFSFGLYTPASYIALQEYQEENDQGASVLLQTCLGLSAAIGCAIWGIITSRPSTQCLISRQYLCQGALIGVAISQVVLGTVQDYHGLVLASGLYGISLGGTLYSLKMLALERLRFQHFAKSWALVQTVEAMSILFGVPLTGYMNASNPRIGYYACSLSSLCGAALLFLVGWGRTCSPMVTATSEKDSLKSIPCACPTVNITPVTRLNGLLKSQSLHILFNRNESQHSSLATQITHKLHTSCMEEFQRSNFYSNSSQQLCEQFAGSCGNSQFSQGTLRSSKSVPEGLDHQLHRQYYELHHQQQQQQDLMQQQIKTPKRCRDVMVIEQITTSV